VFVTVFVAGFVAGFVAVVVRFVLPVRALSVWAVRVHRSTPTGS
jgi:hypothetical protein